MKLIYVAWGHGLSSTQSSFGMVGCCFFFSLFMGYAYVTDTSIPNLIGVLHEHLYPYDVVQVYYFT
jgi:hypothetical protein